MILDEYKANGAPALVRNMAATIDNQKQDEQAEKLLSEPGHLLRIYEEQFRHIRHLESIETLSFGLITVLTISLLVILHLPIMSADSMNGETHEPIGLGVIALVILGGPGIYGTTRRASYRMRHQAIINQAGLAIGAVRLGVIPASLGGGVPGNLGDFWKRLILGYRGPVIVLYSVLMWGTVISVVFETQHGAVSWPLAGAIGLGLVVAANLTSTLTSWSQLKGEMVALKQEVELGASTGKNLAEQHCDLAESLVRLRPPRLNEALSHYQQALELEPASQRAKAGMDKLMSWKVQDYR